MSSQQSRRRTKLRSEAVGSAHCQSVNLDDCNNEELNKKKSTTSKAEKLNVAEEAKKILPIFKHVLNNEWDSIYRKLEGDSFIRDWTRATLETASSLLALDQSLAEEALAMLVKALEKIEKHRKKNMGYIFEVTGNDYTDEECVAELAYAEMNLLYGVLTAFVEQSFIGYVKSAYRVNICFSSFKKFKRLMDEKTNWQDDYLKREFETAINLQLGSFNFGLSVAPRKVAWILELLGYETDRDHGLALMDAAATNEIDSGHKLLAVWNRIVAQVTTENFMGLGEMKRHQVLQDLQYFRNIIHYEPFLMVVDAKLNMIRGDLDTARQQTDQLVKDGIQPSAVQFSVVWDAAWICVFQRDWSAAAHYMNIMVEKCNWSRAAFSYMKGVFIFMLIESDPSKRASREEEMLQCFANVRKLKRNWGGQTAFHEKLVIDRSKQVLKDPKSLVLPHLDLIHLLNMMSIFSSNPKALQSILQDISETSEKLRQTGSLDADKQLYLLFMTAMTQRHLGEDEKAREAFIKIINSADELKREVQLPPQACLELGLIYKKNQDKEQATHWFKKARKYSNYITEILINKRAEVALKSMSHM